MGQQRATGSCVWEVVGVQKVSKCDHDKGLEPRLVHGPTAVTASGELQAVALVVSAWARANSSADAHGVEWLVRPFVH